jgi:Ni,Fe-hydrogenase I cytochrome b subunit
MGYRFSKLAYFVMFVCIVRMADSGLAVYSTTVLPPCFALPSDLVVSQTYIFN